MSVCTLVAQADKRFCRAHGLVPSMSRHGNCWDHAVMDVLQQSEEGAHSQAYLHMARADVFDYIEVFYNRSRRHSHLGGISPEAFERARA